MITPFLKEMGFTSISGSDPLADLMQRSPSLGETGEPLNDNGSRWEPNFELPTADWAPITTQPNTGLVQPITRFVDGAARVSLLGHHIDPNGEWVAVVGGAIGAMCGRIVNRKLEIEQEVECDQYNRTVVAMAYDNYETSLTTQLMEDLSKAGIHLIKVNPRSLGSDLFSDINKARIAAQSRITDEMQKMELLATRGIINYPDTLTVVDGQLATHVKGSDRHSWPVVGIIKRHSIMKLPSCVQKHVIALRRGERSPAFLIEPLLGSSLPSMVSWYIKIAGDRGTAMNGIVRAEVSEKFLQDNLSASDWKSWMNAVSYEVSLLRATREGYDREDCSLQPILMLEDRLHARMGRTEFLTQRLKHKLGLS